MKRLQKNITIIVALFIIGIISMGNVFAQNTTEQDASKNSNIAAKKSIQEKKKNSALDIIGGEINFGFSTTYLWRGYNYFQETYFAEGFSLQRDQSVGKQVFNYYGISVNPEFTLFIEKDWLGFFVNIWTSFDIVPITRDAASDVRRTIRNIRGRDREILLSPASASQNDNSSSDLEIYDTVRLTFGYKSPKTIIGAGMIGFVYYAHTNPYSFGLFRSNSALGVLGPEWEVVTQYSYEDIVLPKKAGKIDVFGSLYFYLVPINQRIEGSVYLQLKVQHTVRFAWFFELESYVAVGQWIRTRQIKNLDNQNRAQLAAQNYRIQSPQVIDSLLTEDWSHVDLGLNFNFYPSKKAKGLIVYINIISSFRIFYTQDARYDVNPFDIIDNFIDANLQQLSAAQGGEYNFQTRNPLTQRPVAHVAIDLGVGYKF